MRNPKTLHDLLYGEVIDSRELIERLEELESDRSDLEQELEDRQEAHEAAVKAGNTSAALSAGEEVQEAADDIVEWDDDNLEELEVLREANEQGENEVSDWRHGETLIAEWHFTAYAMELAYDIGAVQGDERWPLNHIDWESAADELLHDYTNIDIGGETYLVRC